MVVPVAAGEAIWIAIEPEEGAGVTEFALAFELHAEGTDDQSSG